MGQAIGTVLPLAVAIALFPVPVIAVVLLLGSQNGHAKGVAFAATWCLGLAAIGGIVLVFAGALDASDGGEPATWVDVLLLLLGLVVAALGIKQWRNRPRGGDGASTPGWMRAVDEFTLVKAAGAGFALTALNPKNLLLVAAAATEIAEFGLPAAHEAAALLAFVVLASMGVLTPVVIALVLGEGSHALLEGLRSWLSRYNAVIMTVLLLLIGAKLVGDAIKGFAT
jgi:threonine/homoserine/homoserine lactone efflux protein